MPRNAPKAQYVNGSQQSDLPKLTAARERIGFSIWRERLIRKRGKPRYCNQPLFFRGKVNSRRESKRDTPMLSLAKIFSLAAVAFVSLFAVFFGPTSFCIPPEEPLKLHKVGLENQASPALIDSAEGPCKSPLLKPNAPNFFGSIIAFLSVGTAEAQYLNSAPKFFGIIVVEIEEEPVTSGSGFVRGDEFITAGHMVEIIWEKPGTSLTIFLSEKAVRIKQPKNRVIFHPLADMATIALPETLLYPSLEYAREVKKGEKVVIYGATAIEAGLRGILRGYYGYREASMELVPHSIEAKVTEINVDGCGIDLDLCGASLGALLRKRESPPLLTVTVDGNPQSWEGTSGGPVLNKAGELVGIVTGMSGTRPEKAVVLRLPTRSLHLFP